jgi:AcrR family transcriptional regulator
MTEPVKKRAASRRAANTKRPYASAIRQEQAATTRERILDAAEEQFIAGGYGATSVAAIAEHAGVATDTVYKAFGSKVRVLTALIDRRLAPQGDDNVMDRAEANRVRDETDPRRQIELFAEDIAGVLTRVSPVYEILRTAESVEPTAAEVHAEMDRYRFANMRRVAGWLADTGPLRVDEEDAAQLLWVIASPDVGRMLRHGRGLSEPEHARWLADQLTRALLADTEPSP